MESGSHSAEIGQRVEKKQLAKVAGFVAQLPILSLAAANVTIAFKQSYGLGRDKIDVIGNLLCPVVKQRPILSTNQRPIFSTLSVF